MPLCEQLHRLDFDNAEIVTARIGAAGLVTEFGATDDLSVLESITRLADEYLVGWMYWHYKNWGDPTTVSGETGAQGLFSQDSDLTSLKSGKADLLVRPYPQATAGIPLQLAFDPETKVFRYRYTPRPATAPTESGVTNSCAARVITTRTAVPRSFRRRIRSSAL